MSELALWSKAIGWSLLLSLLQALLLGFVLLPLSARVREPARRAWFALTAQLGLLGLFVAGALLLHSSWRYVVADQLPRGLPQMNGALTPAHVAASVVSDRPDLIEGLRWIDGVAGFSGAIWLIGVVLGLLLLWRDWCAVRALLSRGTVRNDLLPMLHTLGARSGVGRAVSAVQAPVASAGVTGWLRPVLLLPAHVERSLSDIQLQAVIAHELAHVRRGDYARSLFERVLCAFLFFNPLVYRFSAVSRRAREEACDDAAVSVCGDRLIYARALERLESARQHIDGRRLAAVSLDDGELLARVRRLVRPSAAAGTARWWPALAPLGSVALLLSLALPSVAAPALPVARLRDRFIRIDAHDPAGKFTVIMAAGRVLSATVNGRAVSPGQLQQRDNRLHFLRADGSLDFAIEITPQGVTWQSRTPAPSS